MSDLEFNIQISGSNNDSNLVLKSESAVINDVEGGASSVSSEKVSALEKKLKILDNLEEIKFKYNIPYIPDSFLPKTDNDLLLIIRRKLPDGEYLTEENKGYLKNLEIVIDNLSKERPAEFGKLKIFVNNSNNFYYEYYYYPGLQGLVSSYLEPRWFYYASPGEYNLPQNIGASLDVNYREPFIFITNNKKSFQEIYFNKSVMPKWEDIKSADKFLIERSNGITKEMYDTFNLAELLVAGPNTAIKDPDEFVRLRSETVFEIDNKQ